MTDRPDILFILSDQHAQRVAGAYGDPVAETPAIDRLAREGVTFDTCYTPSPICGPARMAMLTGQYPHRIGCWTNNDMLASDVPTYAHALTIAGYQTISIGRLHLLGPDQTHGFAMREVGDHSPNWPGVARHDMGVLRRTHGPNRISLERCGPGNSAYQDLDEATLAATLARLDTIHAERRQGRHTPFFIQTGFMLPHPPYVARPDDFERFAGRVPPPRIPHETEAHPWTEWWRQNRGIDDVPDTRRDRARAAYYALVRRMDIFVGAILDRLDDLGLGATTMVVYASDHGDHLGERGLWWKHTMYDESARVPLVMRWPGVVPAGERRGSCVSLLDVSATLLEAAGAVQLPNSDARSLLAVARNADAGWNDTVFSEYCVDPGEPYGGDRWTLQRMIRRGRWKYVHHDGLPDQLFDLSADPDELTDRAGDPELAPLVADLRGAVLAGWDPEAIRDRMSRRARDKALIRNWANRAGPADILRWDFDPDINRLDE